MSERAFHRPRRFSGILRDYLLILLDSPFTMLSYRHSFHAGNHADMLKHLVLYFVLDYYNRKDKAYTYVDTHSGAGLYDLQAAFAQKVGEYKLGWERLHQAASLPQGLQAFVEHVQSTLESEHAYCGSPWLAASLLREQDKAKLFELHPSDFDLLRGNIASLHRGRQIQLRFFHCGLRFFVFRAVVAPRVQGNDQLHADHTGVFTITRTAIVAIACEFFASNLPDQIQ